MRPRQARRRRGQDDEVGAGDGDLRPRRGDVDDARRRPPAPARSPDGDQAAIVQPGGRRIRPDGARDRTGDQPEAEEREVHAREYRSRRTGRYAGCPVSRASRTGRRRAAATVVPAAHSLGAGSSGGRPTGARLHRVPRPCPCPTPWGGRDRPPGWSGGWPPDDRPRAARRAVRRRSAGSAARRRTATRAGVTV